MASKPNPYTKTTAPAFRKKQEKSSDKGSPTVDQSKVAPGMPFKKGGKVGGKK